MVRLVIWKLHNPGEIEISVWSLWLPFVTSWALWALLWLKTNPAQSTLDSRSKWCFLLGLFSSDCRISWFSQIRGFFPPLPLHKLQSHSLAKLPAVGFPFLNHSSFPHALPLNHHPPSLFALYPVFPHFILFPSPVKDLLLTSFLIPCLFHHCCLYDSSGSLHFFKITFTVRSSLHSPLSIAILKKYP